MQAIKKIFVILFLFLTDHGSALYLSNQASCQFPQQGIFFSEENALAAKLGYQAGVVLDRKMELANGLPLQLETVSWVDNLKLFSHQALLSLNIIDRVEIFGTLGAFKLLLTRRPFVYDQIIIESAADLAWSVGGKSTLIFWDNTSLGVAAGYFSSHPNPSAIWLNGHPQNTSSSSFNYNEWQIQIALSQKIAPFSIYVGGAYSYAKLQVITDVFHFLTGSYPGIENYMNRHKLSMIMGVSLFSIKGFAMDLEASAFGETAFNGSWEIRF